jgi:ribosomal protein S18 acetylase RimI-like enzyme
MEIEIRQEAVRALPEYAQVAMTFTVETRLELSLVDHGLGGFVLTERQVAAPYLKDYDTAGEGGPLRWSLDFDVSRWGLIAAHDGETRVGGVVIAFDTPGVMMLEGRRDLAVIWDIRVADGVRRQGVGSRLFRAAEAWAAARGCRQIKVETQNINVPACRFYQRQGCTLGAINRFAYPDLPDEVQLLWYKDLG